MRGSTFIVQVWPLTIKAHEHALDVLRSRLLGVGIGDYGRSRRIHGSADRRHGDLLGGRTGKLLGRAAHQAELDQVNLG
jgi:hypothetical protein